MQQQKRKYKSLLVGDILERSWFLTNINIQDQILVDFIIFCLNGFMQQFDLVRITTDVCLFSLNKENCQVTKDINIWVKKKQQVY